MNRRQFNAASLASVLLPSIRLPRETRVRQVDLSRFCCDPEKRFRYDLTQPFQQRGFNYASDTRVCVRTALPVKLGESTETILLPNAAGLKWSHDEQTGWQPWDAFRRMREPAAPDTLTCPRCEGTGREGAGVMRCPACDGCAEYLTLDGRAHDCACETGWVGGGKCGHCKGTGGVDYAMSASGCRIEPAYHAKIATLGDVEFCVVEMAVYQRKPAMLGYVEDRFVNRVVLFRAADVDGMVCTLREP